MINTGEFLNILKTDEKKVYKLGKIDPNYASGDPKILFDGETKVSVKKYKTINYSPFANDRVLLVNIAGTYLVLGKVGSYSSTGERGPGITNIVDNSNGSLTIYYSDGLTVTTSDLTGPQGKNLEFIWNGTQLGIRQEGQSSYQYVNLKGEKGDIGNGISSIVRTSGNGAAGTTDTYTITFTNGTTTTFKVYNGKDGQIYTHPTSHPATMISVADTAGKFTATNVETALLELFTNVNNGKSLIATAIIDKGGVANGSDTFSELAVEISNLPSGGEITELIAGDSSIYIEDNNITATSNSPKLVREVQVLKTGSIRVKFNLNQNRELRGQIYKNSVAEGILRSGVSSGGLMFSEDFNVIAGDTIQLYIYKMDGSNTSANNWFSIDILLPDLGIVQEM